jgi:hypothetical protein
MAYIEQDGDYLIVGPTFDQVRIYHDRSGGELIIDVPASTGFDFQVGATSVVSISSGGNMIVTGTLAVTGVPTFTAKGDFSTAGINTEQSVTNVHDTTPTDAELDTAFGTPATVGRGFIGTIDDNDASTIGYICWATDANWFWVIGTKAT